MKIKLFESVDSKLAKIGFIKVEEGAFGVSYERKNPNYGYTQCLDLYHKANGRHIMSSYEKGCNKNGFNNSVGLTAYEARLAVKKMAQLGLA